jgi:hypothetical protein
MGDIMRISNDGYINNTSEKIYQADKKSKINKSSAVENSSRSGLNSITASIRESSSQLVSLQTLITREQVASEGLSSLQSKIGQYLSQENLASDDYSAINNEIKNTVKNTVSNGEAVLNNNLVLTQIASRSQLEEYSRTLEQSLNGVSSNINEYKNSLKKLELKHENQVASLSVSSGSSAENEVKDVIKNLGLLFNVQSNIKNEQAKELLA